MKGKWYVSHCTQRDGCRQGLHPNMCQEWNKTEDQGKIRSVKPDIEHEFCKENANSASVLDN